MGAAPTRVHYAASLSRAAPSITAVPFSVIMILGALRMVEVRAGITETPMTPSLPRSCTCSSLSTMLVGGEPIMQALMA